MTNRRELETEDQAIARGDMPAAREAFLRERAATQEAAALYAFFKAHAADVVNCEANAGILRKAAQGLGSPVTEALLEVALLQVRGSLIAPTPERVPLTQEEQVQASNARLRSMSQTEIRAELKRLHPGYRIPQDVVSPELLAMTCKRDVLALTGPQLTKFMYRESDGSKRRANEARINQLLATN
jgi:hypothetical protein